MEGQDVRRRSDAKNDPKARPCEAEGEGLNASDVWGNTRAAQHKQQKMQHRSRTHDKGEVRF